jgi:hypothetical protein
VICFIPVENFRVTQSDQKAQKERLFMITAEADAENGADGMSEGRDEFPFCGESHPRAARSLCPAGLHYKCGGHCRE